MHPAKEGHISLPAFGGETDTAEIYTKTVPKWDPLFYLRQESFPKNELLVK